MDAFITKTSTGIRVSAVKHNTLITHATRSGHFNTYVISQQKVPWGGITTLSGMPRSYLTGSTSAVGTDVSFKVARGNAVPFLSLPVRSKWRWDATGRFRHCINPLSGDPSVGFKWIMCIHHIVDYNDVLVYGLFSKIMVQGVWHVSPELKVCKKNYICFKSELASTRELSPNVGPVC